MARRCLSYAANVVVETSRLLATPEREREDQHGEVFTRRWVAEMILDLVGYTSDRDLASLRALEPASRQTNRRG